MEEAEQSDDLLTRLAGIPSRVASTLAGWDAARLHAPASDGGWSAAEIFAHLRASDDLLSPRAFMILVRDNPPLAANDERRWAEIAGYAQADFHLSLQVFTLRRAELAATLRRVSPGDWQRIGTHEARGPLSLREIITHLVEHEEEHCAELERLASGQSA